MAYIGIVLGSSLLVSIASQRFARLVKKVVTLKYDQV